VATLEMSRADLARLTDRYRTTMNRHDPRALAALYAADCSVESPLFGSLRGREVIEESFRRWFDIFPDVEIRLESAIIDPPQVAVTALTHATHEGELFGLPASHKKIEFRTSRVVTIDDGLIQQERRIYDFTGLLLQLGVLRAKPAR
jgi:steroid delta-isomerase-like uncharacterized protein